MAMEETNMALNAHHDPMTDAQRDEIKQLCREAEIPDKSGELLTRQGAQAIIDDLRHKVDEHKSASRT
jgi:hypothetical protein